MLFLGPQPLHLLEETPFKREAKAEPIFSIEGYP
jgi:hypothetical protein